MLIEYSFTMCNFSVIFLCLILNPNIEKAFVRHFEGSYLKPNILLMVPKTAIKKIWQSSKIEVFEILRGLTSFLRFFVK